MGACYDGVMEVMRGSWVEEVKKTGRQTNLIPCLPFVMHPPHLQSCHWLVRTNHRTPCCLPAMYQFGQDDIKFLVRRVKDHMKTDVLITGVPVLEKYDTHTFSQIRGLRHFTWHHCSVSSHFGED